jgi:type II secretory ATPase GspE/PulE/Tfp pilus assembly ATPase PilB-like protein/ActR/RegA family two-component response regulator
MRSYRDEWLLPTLDALIGAEGLEAVRQEGGESLWEAAVRRRVCTDQRILEALSARYRMGLANLELTSGPARDLVPEALARKYRILPLAVSDTTLDIATSDPNDIDCERTLGFATGRAVRMWLAAPARIAERIEEVYRPENAVEKILDSVGQEYDVMSIADAALDDDIALSTDKAGERPIIRLVDHIIAQAVTQRASDIHIETEEAGLVVRYRVDGVLKQTMTLPRAVSPPLISRVKIISGLDIADRLRPQDGRARVSVNGARVDLRISTLPASHGEKVVIRVLDGRATPLALDSLGLTAHDFARVQQLVNLREGIVLVTGPTGSGKTTTLYSALRIIQSRGVNIVTVEDPVEYKIPGIVQVQVNEKAGLTFAAALRSILRQDPDVVLVGEIRDRETATIATQASLTGHLVLSTLHTIDAASSISRLLDIGVEPYKIAAALKGLIAQRLVRRLCPSCRAPTTTAVDDRFRQWIPSGIELFRPVGCPDCNNTGYRGRVAVTEVIVADGDIERAISLGEGPDRITEVARAGGMRTLWESGITHVLDGLTDLEELVRVVEVPSAAPRRGTPRSSPAVPPQRTQPFTTRQSVVGVEGRRSGEASEAHSAPRPSRAPLNGESGKGHALDTAFELVDDLKPATPAGNRERILLVEDEAPLRGVLRDLLEREGYTVIEAGDGVQALDGIDRSAPDLVVLDLNLPRLDGYGVLKHLRTRASTSSLPVLVLTAKGDEDSEVRVFESGANDFLTKPFRPRALIARLKALSARKESAVRP